jgi:hypothetical protein
MVMSNICAIVNLIELSMDKNNTIECPGCKTQIDVNSVLKHQIQDGLRKEFQAKEFQAKKNLDEKLAHLVKAQSEFDEKKKRENVLFQERLEKQSNEAAILIEKRLKTKLEEENRTAIKEMQSELADKSEKLKDLFQKEAEIEKLKRERNEAVEMAKLEAQKELSEQLQEQHAKLKKQAGQEFEFKIKELQKQLEDQKKLAEEMKRKHEQGSTQLQGEVMELAIEAWLTAQFPLDSIDEIKKGVNGADCIQVVNTREQINCGTIYYESKRTKGFQNNWIEKFKNDIQEKGATIGVLVTEVMPPDMERMGLKDGIWICSFEEFKALCAVLRQSIIQWNRLKIKQENKGDKMGMLYDFLTSEEFYLQMQGIVDGFTQMQVDLQKEKNAMTRIWKQREKQLDKVVDNAIGMHASIKGIAGNAVKSIASLELCEPEIEYNLNLKQA